MQSSPSKWLLSVNILLCTCCKNGLGKCLDYPPWNVSSVFRAGLCECNPQTCRANTNICTKNRLIYALLSVFIFFIIEILTWENLEIASSDDHRRAFNKGTLYAVKAWYGACWPCWWILSLQPSSRKHGWMFKSTHVKDYHPPGILDLFVWNYGRDVHSTPPPQKI